MALAPGLVVNESGTPSTPKFVKIAFIGRTTESNTLLKPMNIITHWRVQTVLPGGSMAALLANMQAAFATVLTDCCTSDYELVQIEGQYLDAPNFIPVIDPVGFTGAIATDRKASFVAGVIRKLTGVPSRNCRGSMHVGALPEAFTTKDQLNSTGQTAYNALRTAWNGAASAGIDDGAQVWFPIVLSATRSDLFSTPCLFTYAPVTSHTLNLRIGTMKRRKETGTIA